MNIVKTQVDHLLVCRLDGRFDAHQVPRLKSELEPLQGSLHFDFSRVTFIDSSGLAALVSLYKKVREAGFTFEISGIQDAVRLILELTGLDTILPVHAAPVLAHPVPVQAGTVPARTVQKTAAATTGATPDQPDAGQT